MSTSPGRRAFVKLSLAAGAASAAPAFGQAPAVVPSRVKPVVVASANGHVHRNKGPRTCVEEAFDRIVRGEDILDALVAGVTILELDPLEDSVGYGGLPNADGVVQLDASCIHGPRRQAGAVAALEGVRTPAQVARAVMRETDHHLLVGRGAQEFARRMGFEVEDDLNTESSRRKWRDWRRRIDPEHWLDPAKRSQAGEAAARAMLAEGILDENGFYGTVNCNGVGPTGELAGVTTTSGLAWKIPGRVGDSPILGAGLYVDGEVGAAGSTGRGEANLFNLGSFLIVENLRRGMSPLDAALETLRRIHRNTEKRLLDELGRPTFNLKFYVVDRQGRHAGASFWGGKDQLYAVCTEKGPETPPLTSLFGERPKPAA